MPDLDADAVKESDVKAMENPKGLTAPDMPAAPPQAVHGPPTFDYDTLANIIGFLSQVMGRGQVTPQPSPAGPRVSAIGAAQPSPGGLPSPMSPLPGQP